MALEIVVCVKQVADPEALVEVHDGELSVEARLITSFFDEVAVEQALQLRDRFGGRVTAITAGTGKATDALRRAVAMGADRAIQVDDPALDGADALGVARALAGTLKGEPCDLLLCGQASLDAEAGAVGPALAELLRLPVLTGVVSLEIDDDGAALVAGRAVEGGRSVEACALPAALTVGKGLVEPRVPPVTGVMKAMRAPIDRRSLADVGLSADAVAAGWVRHAWEAPPRRATVQMIPGDPPQNVDALVAALRERGVSG